MIYFVFVAAAFLVASSLAAQGQSVKKEAENKTATLIISVTNISDDEGVVRAALYNRAEEFPRGKVFKGEQATPKNGRAALKFESLPEGEYAVAVLHDRNGNKKMDYNVFGLPTEGYGFSNGAKAVFSAPSFHDAKFQLSAGDEKIIAIRIQ
jgi:uncharacterized protein (DUF2141 family)